MTAAAGGWTVETVRDHLESVIALHDRRYEQRFADQQQAVEAALSAAKEAVIKAETAAEKRFEGVNEFRAALGDQQRLLMPRSEADRAITALSEKLLALEKQFDGLVAERQGLRGGWGYAVGVIGFVLALASLIALVIKQVP